MMRNSINFYLTTLVMVLALLLSANAFALTQSSPITIDGKEYTLFTGFTAIDGSDVASGKVFSNMVDGNLSSEWHPIGQSNSSESYSSLGYAYLEFSSDVPIAIKGFILNSFNEKYYLPSEMRLLAKADEQADYVEISSYTDLSYTGTEKSFSVDNAQNNQYSFFRLECTNKSKNIWMTEIRLYAGDDLTYGFMPKKSATCTETGIKQACYLRSDGKYFTDETGTTEIPKEDAFDPIKPHDLIHHEEDDAHYEYWECSVCGKKFGDAEGSRELDDFDFYHVYTKLRKLVISSDNMVLIDFDDTHSNNVKYKVVGDVITFRVLEKYVDVNSIKVSDGINDYPITSEGNGNYSFTVPAADVTISVEKKPKYEGLSFFEIVTYVDRNTVTTDIFHSGLSTIRLNSGIVYNIYEGNNTYFNEDEGRFGGAHSGFSVPKTGWYDISFNEVGDGKWNLSISATTRKPQIETISDQVYTGEDIMPKPVVTLDLYDLTEGTDYEYSYTNNVNVGSSATVTVTFKGDYAEFGSVSKSFNITKATPTVEPPTSANPKYAGACVALVTAGSTNFGTMLYRLDDDYSENIPCADKGGDYTVYYEVEGNDNWSAAAGSVEIQVPVRVDVSVVGDGSVSGYDPDEFYPVGTVLTLTAVPADGYKFLSWNSDVDVPATFEYTVDAEQNSLEATFSNHYIAYTTSDGDTALPLLSSMYNIKKNKCEDGLCVMFLGDGVTELGSGAFHGNERLTSIEIPSSIETIGHFAFAETPLIRVDMKSKVPPQLGDWAFDAVPDEFLIHVPHGSADAYRSANGWKDYKDHIVDHDASMLVWNDDAVVPTCSETGWEAGYICNECHKRFADVDGHVEMSPVAALGTTYGAACIYNDDSKAIIDGNSETSVLLPRNIDVDAIELNRTFAAGTISTITLPFSMYVENVEGAVFYRFKYVSSDDWTVHVGSVRDELIANTPYLVKTTGETISFKTGATLERILEASPTDLGQDEGDGWELRGTYGKMVWKEGHPDLGYVYGFAAENVADVHIGEFVKATAGANLPPMRAYLYYNPVATPEPSFRGMAPMARSTSSIETPNYLDVVVDDDEGGTLYIGKLNTRTGEFNAAGDRWFDLKGRKLNGKPSVKGSFFNNKSKVIVK